MISDLLMHTHQPTVMGQRAPKTYSIERLESQAQSNINTRNC